MTTGRYVTRPTDGPVRAHDAVHVVTVTHNSASTLGAYFAALHADSRLVAGITIVDNASIDSTVAAVRAQASESPLSIELIESTNAGFAGGYATARGSRVRRGIPVLALNPDVALAPGAIGAMLDVLNSFPDAAVVTTPLVDLTGAPDSASRRRLPTLSGSIVYSMLGARTPAALRYNSQVDETPTPHRSAKGIPVSPLEATTGALMLVAPEFRPLDDGIFDTDYWMYGEDLQLCVDARTAGRTVLMAEVHPSVHVKGVSSGRPRSRKSNRAFHTAMTIYARKNLLQHPAALFAVKVGIETHFAASELRALPSRRARARQARVAESGQAQRTT